MEKAVTERGRWGKESGKCSTWFIPDIETESAIRNGMLCGNGCLNLLTAHLSIGGYFC